MACGGSISEQGIFGKAVTKYMAYLTIATATMIGSCTSHKEDFPPFYIKKTGTSSGNCMGFVTEIDTNATFYGTVLSFANKNKGTIKGANISFFNRNSGTIDGLSLAVIGNASEGTNSAVTGLEAAIVGNHKFADKDLQEKVKGVQIGLAFNYSREGSKGVQIGCYNSGVNMEGEKAKGCGLNIIGQIE